MKTYTPQHLHSAAHSAASFRPASLACFGTLATRLRSWSQPLRQALLVGSAALLVACGGGGGGGAAVPPPGGGSPPDVADPGAPATPAGLSLGAAGIKTLNFQWTAVDGATYYHLLEDLDGTGTASSPVAVSTSIAATQYGHEVPLYERLNATYTLRACNALGCSASSAAFKPSIANLNAAIGYAKATGGGVAGDQYGAAIALSKDGNTLAVGAPFEDTNAPDSGAVHVMRRSAAGIWTPFQILKDNSPTAAEFFGYSLALSANGHVLAVGAPQGVRSLSDGGTATTGHVQMFNLNADQSAYTAGDTVRDTSDAVNEWFGYSVALDNTGDVLAVGAYLNPLFGYAKEGEVHILTRNGAAWTHTQVITASNGEGNDSFGYAIALSGDGQTLAVGAFKEDSGIGGIFDEAEVGAAGADDDSVNSAGAVYVFSRSGTAATDLFSNQIYIKGRNQAANDFFGSSVALSNDGSVLAVGTTGEDYGGVGVAAEQGTEVATNSGAVYVFVRSGAGVWSQEVYIKASNTTQNAQFGSALAISADGNTLAVGARHEHRTGVGLGAAPDATEGGNGSGAVYVFKRSAGVWTQSAYLKSPTTPANNGSFGGALALSGDGRSLAVGNVTEAHSASPTASYPVVGAPESEDGLALTSGAVYIF